MGHSLVVVEGVVDHVHPHPTEAVKHVHRDVVPVAEQAREMVAIHFVLDSVVARVSDIICILDGLVIVIIAVKFVILFKEWLSIEIKRARGQRVSTAVRGR